MNNTSTSERKKNIEIAELRQDTTEKQTNALETRIKYFQDQQSNHIPGNRRLQSRCFPSPRPRTRCRARV